ARLSQARAPCAACGECRRRTWSPPRHRSDETHEVVEEEGRILGSGGGLGVELDAEERASAGADALAGAIVHIDEPGLPVAGQCLLPHRVAVVLAGDVAAPGEQILHRLVYATVAVRQLVGVAPCSERQDLVS